MVRQMTHIILLVTIFGLVINTNSRYACEYIFPFTVFLFLIFQDTEAVNQHACMLPWNQKCLIGHGPPSVRRDIYDGARVHVKSVNSTRGACDASAGTCTTTSLIGPDSP